MKKLTTRTRKKFRAVSYINKREPQTVGNVQLITVQ